MDTILCVLNKMKKDFKDVIFSKNFQYLFFGFFVDVG